MSGEGAMTNGRPEATPLPYRGVLGREMLIMLALLDLAGLCERDPAALYGEDGRDLVGLGGRGSSPFASMLTEILLSGAREPNVSYLEGALWRMLCPYKGRSSAGTSGERLSGWVREVFTPASGLRMPGGPGTDV